jgi:cation diffusion facilitator CzcD-associated flavoprotein CzcO
MTITAEATRPRETTGVGARQEPIERWDVVVIGAGLAGMYQLLRLRERVPLESGYYEVFNQPNVELVDVRESPIERITETGIRTRDGERAFDMIIFATSFDAITGSFDRIDIRRRGGQRLKDKWADGPQTYLGLNVEGFPNMLTWSARTMRRPSATCRAASSRMSNG